MLINMAVELLMHFCIELLDFEDEHPTGFNNLSIGWLLLRLNVVITSISLVMSCYYDLHPAKLALALLNLVVHVN
jgi:hypothetical protein